MGRTIRALSVCAGLLIGFAAAAALLSPGNASAKAVFPRSGDASRTAGQVAAYWTESRMESARPLGAITVDDGAAGSDPQRDPVLAVAPPLPFTSSAVTDTLSFPNRVHGKVFFTRPGVGNFVCSGTAVDAVNRATVLTAGHCVHSAGVWSTNFAFVPSYRIQNGLATTPYGVWAATSESAPQQWVDSETFNYDVGAVVVAVNSSGQDLEEVVGARGVVFNQAIGQAFRSYGYPAQPTSTQPFDGTKLWACDASISAPDAFSATGGPSTIGIGCDMTGGSSGGGWVTTGSQGGELNGVNSYKYTSQPNVMYGPYFGASIEGLYDFAAGVPPGSTSTPAAGDDDPAPQSSGPVPAQRSTCKKRKRSKRKHRGKRVCRQQSR